MTRVAVCACLWRAERAGNPRVYSRAGRDAGQVFRECGTCFARSRQPPCCCNLVVSPRTRHKDAVAPRNHLNASDCLVIVWSRKYRQSPIRALVLCLVCVCRSRGPCPSHRRRCSVSWTSCLTWRRRTSSLVRGTAMKFEGGIGVVVFGAVACLWVSA